MESRIRAQPIVFLIRGLAANQAFAEQVDLNSFTLAFLSDSE